MLITVTGLPRTGTAFVSMLLALNPDCISYHELASYDADWRNTVMLPSICADCNTYGYLPEYDVEPDKRVYIVGNIQNSHRSAEKACQRVIPFSRMYDLWDAGSTWAAFNDCFVIGRGDVFTVGGCENIWRYCFDTEPPTEKIRQLVKLNIQHHNAHIQFGEGKTFKL